MFSFRSLVIVVVSSSLPCIGRIYLFFSSFLVPSVLSTITLLQLCSITSFATGSNLPCLALPCLASCFPPFSYRWQLDSFSLSLVSSFSLFVCSSLFLLPFFFKCRSILLYTFMRVFFKREKTTFGIHCCISVNKFRSRIVSLLSCQSKTVSTLSNSKENNQQHNTINLFLNIEDFRFPF